MPPPDLFADLLLPPDLERLFLLAARPPAPEALERVRDLPFDDPRPPVELDFFELADFELERFEAPEDFFGPDFALRDDLRPLDFAPAEPLRELEDLDPPVFFDDDFFPPDELLFFEPLFFPPEDFRDLRPTARPAAPAACDAARFAESTFRGLFAALPASAPITPPMTVPIGPATLPTTAPAAAPA